MDFKNHLEIHFFPSADLQVLCSFFLVVKTYPLMDWQTCNSINHSIYHRCVYSNSNTSSLPEWIELVLERGIVHRLNRRRDPL